MKCREATLAGRRRGGSFNRRIDSNGSLNEPPRPRQTKCLRAIFLDGAATPPLPLLCPTSFAGHGGALKTTGGKAEVPSLDKEGWLRPLRKCCEASFSGRRRGGWFKPPIIGS